MVDYLSVCVHGQSCLTLCHPMDCSPPGSSVYGILQARILEWVFHLFQGIFPIQGSNPGLLHCRWVLYCLSYQGSPLPTLLLLLLSRFSRVRLCATPQTVAHKAPSSLGFSRQEHWSGLPLVTGQILEYNQNLKQLSKDIPWIDSVYLCGYWYWWNIRSQGKRYFHWWL